MATADQPQFEQSFHDALTHYADSAWLQASPLLTAFTSDEIPLGDRVGRLRELLRGAVQALRPPDGVPLSAPEWLPYRVLWSRCIQRQTQVRICREMSLSRATYYRYHAQAMACAARAMWSRAGGASEPATSLSTRPGLMPVERGIEEAERLARSSRREPLDVTALLGQVQSIVAGLLEQSELELELDLAPDLPRVLGDPTVLRQVFVNLLAGAAHLASSAGMGSQSPGLLALVAETGDDAISWRLEGVADGEEPMEFRIARRLIEVYGGAYTTVGVPCGRTLCFDLPSARPITILLVDDDEGAHDLYRRHLGRAGYALEALRSGEFILESVQAKRPDLILLDVLMPREDGWLVLQRLQTMPETVDIPVIVASVLAQSDLALTLGASGVISKPITEQALLSAVTSALADSVG